MGRPSDDGGRRLDPGRRPAHASASSMASGSQWLGPGKRPTAKPSPKDCPCGLNLAPFTLVLGTLQSHTLRCLPAGASLPETPAAGAEGHGRALVGLQEDFRSEVWGDTVVEGATSVENIDRRLGFRARLNAS